MPDLLLELFSEEIPARMQRQAAGDLERLVTSALMERGLKFEGAVSHATPRRLALHIAGLPPRQPDVREEKKGPRVGAPDAAVQGFLKSAGLASLDQAKIEKDPKKGEFYVAVIEREGKATLNLLAEILPAIIRAFPWPKSMRWGAASVRSDSLRWVRPLISIVATFGPENEEPDVVPFEIDGVSAGNITYGHRFLAPTAIKVRRFDDYLPALERAKVVLDTSRRKDIILHDARDLAFAQGLELVEDDHLLEEVAGLVEWPVTLMGSFDERFLAIPPEAIRATIRANQKCFVLRTPSPRERGEGGAIAPDEGPVGSAKSLASDQPLTPTLSPQAGRGGDGALANRFILVANIAASDGGAEIVAGNERVVAARLSDAKFFYETDLRTKLEDRLLKLDSIVFHEKLGTQGERVKRIEALARELAPKVGADPAKAARAAMLCKADLVTEMVGEFPELQGLMGRYYALAQGEDASVAAAIEEHYKPQGPGDRIPTDPVSVAVALADKIDTLVGFWAIDEKPTGSKDPYALRRAALGVIRIVLENGIRLSLRDAFTITLIYLDYRSAMEMATRIEIEGELFFFQQNSHEPLSYPASTAFRSNGRAFAVINHDGLYESVEQSLLDYLWSEKGSDPALNAWQLADLDRIRERIGADERELDSVFKIKRVLDRITQLHDVADRPSDLGPAAISNVRQIAAYIRDDLPEYELYRQLVVDGLLAFFADRLKVYLREKGARHDLIDAIFALEGQDDLLMIVRRVEALDKFLATDDGKNLVAGYKRAANILRAEEKKDGAGAFDHPANIGFLSDYEERALKAAIDRARDETGRCVKAEDFEGAMHALSKLRAPVDAFFDKVTVNSDDPRLRKNRLELLNELRTAMHQVADFSKVAG